MFPITIGFYSFFGNFSGLLVLTRVGYVYELSFFDRLSGALYFFANDDYMLVFAICAYKQVFVSTFFNA